MSKTFLIDNPNQTIKGVIHQEKDSIIFVRSFKQPDGKYSKNTLVKAELKTNKDGQQFGKHRGLNMNDLLILKRNWGQILKAMAK